MNKSEVLSEVICQLQNNLLRQKAASEQAKESATDSESRAETKWDTTGLEASYLARGYARQFEETVQQLEMLKSFPLQDMTNGPIAVGSLLLTELGEYRDWIFVLPHCGGMEVDVDGTEVTIITPESPLGCQLMHIQAGSDYRTPAGALGKVIEVL